MCKYTIFVNVFLNNKFNPIISRNARQLMNLEAVWLLTLEDLYSALTPSVDYRSTKHTALHCTTLRSSAWHYDL